MKSFIKKNKTEIWEVIKNNVPLKNELGIDEVSDLEDDAVLTEMVEGFVKVF